jgi:site-specific DNA-methyltransferase (adenine-specific)/site-specific DNA-methyltransferase (cytosine-N4-specific)
VRKYLAADGSFFVNIKEHAEDGERHPYVKRLLLSMIDDGWKWVDEYAWVRQGIPGSAEMMGRFRNAWESVFWFAIGDPKFRPRAVMHESDGAFTYADQVAAGKTIGAKNQGRGDATNSPVGHGAGMAYPSNVLDLKQKAETIGHAAAFPVELPAFFINANSDTGDVVYEPFCGSGTTLIACEQLGRRCYGMEISPTYCDVIISRWEKLTGRTAERVEQTATAAA